MSHRLSRCIAILPLLLAGADWAGELPLLKLCCPDGCELGQQVSDTLPPVRLCVPAALRPPAWARPLTLVRLRIALDTGLSAAEQPWRGVTGAPTLARSGASRGFCKWFSNTLLASLCRDCSHEPCPLTAKPIYGTFHYAAYLPSSGNQCLHVKQLPKDVRTAQATWEVYWDPFVALRCIVGLTLLWGSGELQHNAVVHAAVGGSASLALVILVSFLWISRELRNTLGSTVPFGGLLGGLLMLSFSFIPSLRQVAMSCFSSIPLGSGWWQMVQSVRDPVFQLPVGYIAVVSLSLAALGVVVAGANISVRYFASAPDPMGEVAFVIGSDGRRIDLLPSVPLPQWLFGWALWAIGAVCLLASTHVDGWSVVLLALALMPASVIHAFMQFGSLTATESPANLRPLISAADFRVQSEHSTRMALDALRAHLKANPTAVCSVREESELRLRRFSDGGMHTPPAYKNIVAKSSSWCVLL